jgi:hypothetical protein
MVDGSDTVSCDNSAAHPPGEHHRRRKALDRNHEPSTARFRLTFPDAGSGEVVVTIAAWKTLVSHPVTFSYPPAAAK